MNILLFQNPLKDINTFLFRITLIFLIISTSLNLYDIFLFSDNFSIQIFNNSIYINSLILTQEFILSLIAIFVLITFKNYLFKPETLVLLIVNLISCHFILESSNFILLFISWELFNLSLYIIIYNKGDGLKTLASSTKYFLLSALATNLLLLSLALFYHVTGTLDFQSLIIFFDINYLDPNNISLAFATILLISTIMFKLGASPLHFLAPDLYDATPIRITFWIANIPKILYLFLLFNLYHLGLLHSSNSFLLNSDNLLLFFGASSIIIGALGLTQQIKIKRFLTYSGISNLGYILLTIPFISIFFYNIFIYLIAIINIFYIIILLQNISKSDISYIHYINGLYKHNPFIAIAFSISLFSIAGIPPLPGFFAKYLLLQLLIDNYHLLFISFIIFATMITVANYIRLLFAINFNIYTQIYSYSHENNSLYLIITFLTTLLTLFQFIP